MENQFFSMLSRMKYIDRWALMRNTSKENISEHSLQVAFFAHALGVIKNKRFDGNINCDRLAVIAMFHDVSEIITGDLPTPVKYYNPQINNAYKEVENVAVQKMLSYLPDDIRQEYALLLCKNDDDKYLYKLVKAADKLSALAKCIEEEKMGNSDFLDAKETILSSIREIGLPEVQVFLEEFMPAFGLSLDKQA